MNNEKSMIVALGLFALYNLYQASQNPTEFVTTGGSADDAKSNINTAMLAYGALVYYVYSTSLSKNDMYMYFFGGHLAVYYFLLSKAIHKTGDKVLFSMFTFGKAA